MHTSEHQEVGARFGPKPLRPPAVCHPKDRGIQPGFQVALASSEVITITTMMESFRAINNPSPLVTSSRSGWRTGALPSVTLATTPAQNGPIHWTSASSGILVEMGGTTYNVGREFCHLVARTLREKFDVMDGWCRMANMAGN